MFTFLHAADIHLDSPLLNLEKYEGVPADAVRNATRRAFENLIELALDRRPEFVLISGDLYDGSWKDYNTGLFFVARMIRLKEAGIPVYLIAGNHDATSRMTKNLRLPDNVYFLPADRPATVQIDSLGVAIHGQGFDEPRVFRDLSEDYPAPVTGYYNIGMLHTGANSVSHHEPYAPCTIEGLVAKGYDYWALGHVHQKKTLCEEPWIVFPGNIQGRHVRETGTKGCMMVSVEDTGKTTVEFHPLDVIRWEVCRVDAKEQWNMDDLLESTRRELESVYENNAPLPCVVRIGYEGYSRAYEQFFAEWENRLNEIRACALEIGRGGIWIEKITIGSDSLVPPASYNPLHSGPIAAVEERIDSFLNDPGLLQQILEEKKVFTDLLRQLPPELKNGIRAVNPEDPDYLKQMLQQVKPFLIKRLTTSRIPE